MKEPWKKTCNGKVIITLNDEKTTPTEVEVPVDLNWANRSERPSSAKTFTLVATVLVLGLTIITLFKVQNLVYTSNYINWRMQELESAVGDSNDDIKMMKYRLSLADRDSVARAEALIAPLASSKSVDAQLESQDLRLSESQNLKQKLSNSLSSSDSKDSRETASQSSSKAQESANAKVSQKVNDALDMSSDARDQPNPSDPDELFKPLIESLDIIGSQPMEENFIQNVLMKLLMPEKNNIEVVELNKLQDAAAAAREAEEQQQQPKLIPMNQERPLKPLPWPIESMLMKTLLPPMTSFKIFHLNERPEQQQQQQQQQQSNLEEDMVARMPRIRFKQILSPIDQAIVKSILPPSNMKILHYNDKEQMEDQRIDEDQSKITVQSIMLKMMPMVPLQENRRDVPLSNDDMNNMGPMNMMNMPFPFVRISQAPEPMPKMPLRVAPLPGAIQDIMQSIFRTKDIEIVPLPEQPQTPQHPQDADMGIDQQQPQQQQPPQQDKNSDPMFPFHEIQNIVMKMLPPVLQNDEPQYDDQPQDQEIGPSPDLPQVPPFAHSSIPEHLMKPVANPESDNYNPIVINVAESQPEVPPPPQQPQQQQQVPQMPQQQPQQEEQQQQPEQTEQQPEQEQGQQQQQQQQQQFRTAKTWVPLQTQQFQRVQN